jgi:poly(hydroxyalkanoate) depolymerase family esterase
MKKAAGLLRSLVRSGTRQSRSVGKLMTALFAAPVVKPKRKRKPAAAKPAAAKSSVAKPSVAKSGTAKPAAAKRVVARAGPRPLSVPSVATHVPASPGKWLASHFAVPPGIGTSGRRMSYWLYLPNNVPESAAIKGLPLLVMLHGCHQTATQFAQGTRMNHWAEQMGYAVLYPQQLVSSHAQRCWKWYDRATQEGGGDVPMIVGMVHQVMARYAVDPSRIYVAGISAGAGMANIIALNHPRLIAGVGLHSGPVFGAGHSTIGALGVMQHGAGMRADMAVREVLQRHPQFPGMPTILIQGEGDSVVRPINQIQLARQSLALNGMASHAPPKVTHKPSAGSRNAHRIHDFYDGRKLLVRVAQIDDLEHAWSGGDPTLAFNAKAGPDASKMMLEFFSRHQRA